MKNVILSADGDRYVYCIPDESADNLEKYCMEFCDDWLKTSPNADKYRVNGILYYNQSDFIEYLNKWVFPEKRSKLVENLGWIPFDAPVPDKYKECPQFNF